MDTIIDRKYCVTHQNIRIVCGVVTHDEWNCCSFSFAALGKCKPVKLKAASCELAGLCNYNYTLPSCHPSVIRLFFLPSVHPSIHPSNHPSTHRQQYFRLRFSFICIYVLYFHLLIYISVQ